MPRRGRSHATNANSLRTRIRLYRVHTSVRTSTATHNRILLLASRRFLPRFRPSYPTQHHYHTRASPPVTFRSASVTSYWRNSRKRDITHYDVATSSLGLSHEDIWAKLVLSTCHWPNGTPLGDGVLCHRLTLMSAPAGDVTEATLRSPRDAHSGLLTSVLAYTGRQPGEGVTG